MKKYLPSLVLVVTTFLVSACSDPKAANDKNFKVAIQKSLDSDFPWCYVKTNFPVGIPEHFKGESVSLIRALANAGLLSVENEPRKGSIFNPGTTQPVYSLTEDGEKFYTVDVDKDIRGRVRGGFCFGKATVKEISNFSEPVDADGYRYSRVQYTYEISDIPTWAKLPEILAASSGVRVAVGSLTTPIRGFEMLVLQNKGWVSQTDMVN